MPLIRIPLLIKVIKTLLFKKDSSNQLNMKRTLIIENEFQLCSLKKIRINKKDCRSLFKHGSQE